MRISEVETSVIFVYSQSFCFCLFVFFVQVFESGVYQKREALPLEPVCTVTYCSLSADTNLARCGVYF
jgi:hypothetical protein